MKFSSVLTSATCLVQLLSFPTISVQAANKCGTWATEDCIGDVDARYDPDVSTNLQDLHPLYKKFEGYWVGTSNTYGPDRKVVNSVQTPGNPRAGLPYPSANVSCFFNITLSGSRFYQHDLYVHAPADAEFCSQALNPPFTNVLDDGMCGVNGWVEAGELFRTSTHEVDEVTVDVAGTGRYDMDEATGYARPLDEQVFYSAIYTNEFLVTTTYTFSEDHSSMSVRQLVYRFIGSDIVFAVEVVGELMKSSKENYRNRIDAAYTKHNITTETAESFHFPIELGGCLAPPCPKEEDWAKEDPNLTKSPYQEQYKVKAGVIAGFTVIAALLLIAAIVAFYQWKILEIKKNARQKFASRLQKSSMHLVSANESNETASPADLIESFNRIDSGSEEGGDGLISKNELWTYINKNKDDGVVKKNEGADMTKKEFDVLFTSVDKDGSNMIDFSEYCAFIAELNRME